MKVIIRYILSFYFAFVFTIGNAGVPYLIHTCTISKQSDYHFFITEKNDEECCFSACVAAETVPVLLKDSCCVLETGIIQSDVDVVASEVVNNISDQEFYFENLNFVAFQFADEEDILPFFSNAPPTLSGRQIVILHQSFLC